MPRVLAGLLIATALSACGAGPGTPPLTKVADYPDILGALEANLADRRTVTVSGEGVVRVPPDTAMVTVGLERRTAQAADAQDQVNAAAKAVLAAWHAKGLPDAAMQTVGLDL